MHSHSQSTSFKVSNQGSSPYQYHQAGQQQNKSASSQEIRPTKPNIFSVHPMFGSQQKDQSSSIPQTPRQPPQHISNPIMSRSTQKKIIAQSKIDTRKRRVKYFQTKSKDLSLIHQTDSEQFLSSSQSGMVSDSSHEDQNSQSEESQYQSIYDKLNQADNQSQLEKHQLNKTVLMSKKKPRHAEIQQTQFQVKTRDTQLAKLLTKYSLEQLYEFYQAGTIQQDNFRRLLAINKDISKKAKQDKFNQNLEKIHRLADIVMNNFKLLVQKLTQDLSVTQSKHKELIKMYVSIVKESQSSSDEFHPQKMRFEVKVHEKHSQVKSKKIILQNLNATFSEFQRTYQQHLVKLDNQKNQKENFSQNLLFRQIRDFLKLSHQLYKNIISSLKKNKLTGQSIIDQKAKQFYTKTLSEKYSRELKLVEQLYIAELVNEASSIMDSGEQLSQQKFQTLQKQIKANFRISLRNVTKSLHQNMAWVKIIRYKGQLNYGRLYKKAVDLLKHSPPTTLSLEEFEQNSLIENCKFYRKTVFKKLMIQIEPLEKLYYFLQTNIEMRNIFYQQKKFKNLINHVTLCQHKGLIINCTLSKILAKQKRSETLSQNRQLHQINKTKNSLIEKLRKLQILQNKAFQVLQQKETKTIKKSLIPKTKISTYNFRQYLNQQSKQTYPKPQSEVTWPGIFTKMQKKKPFLTETDACTQQITRQNIQDYKYQKDDIYGRFKQKKFGEDMENIFRHTESSPADQMEKQQHFNKAYELILKNQVSYPQFQRQKNLQGQPYEPQNYSVLEDLFSSIKLTGSKPPVDEDYLYLNVHPKNTYSRPHLLDQFSFKSKQKYSWLSSSQSVQEIESACELFVKEFYKSPGIRKKLQLNDHQFHFLMAPDYRKYFLDKKSKDQQLTNKILSIVSLNTPQINGASNNPVKNIMYTDPHFQQRVEQYQHKIVKNQQALDPNQPRLVYDFDDISTTDSSSEYGLLDGRIKQLQERRMMDYYFDKYSEHERRYSEFGYGQTFFDC